MVEQNDERGIGVYIVFLHYLSERQSVDIALVVAADYRYVAERNGRITQHNYASLIVESACRLNPCQIFMIAETCHHGSLDAVELLRHTLLVERFDRAVDDVACHKHQVGILGIYHIHPSGKLLAVVIISEVEVGDKHNLPAVHSLCRLHGKTLTMLAVVVHIAINKDRQHHHSQ